MSRQRKPVVVQAEEVIENLHFDRPVGRHECPIPDCEQRFDSVGEKKRHIRKDHPR